MKERSRNSYDWNQGLRLDGWGTSHYVSPMQRWLTFILLVLFALFLTGCGIKGGLQTPPPLWGDEVAQADDVAAETDLAAVEEEEDDLTYGVDVAD